MSGIINVMGIAPGGSIETLRGILSCDGISTVKLISANPETVPGCAPEDTDCAVMYTSGLEGADFKFLESFHDRYPRIAVVVLADTLELEVFERAMHCGATKLLPADTDPDKICDAVIREGRRAAGAEFEDARRKRGHIMSFFSTRGGAGKTYCAINAAAVSAEAGRRTLIIDAVHPFGDTGYLLNAGNSMSGPDIPMRSKSSVFSPHVRKTPSGIFLLDPFESLPPDFSDPGAWDKLLSICSENFDTVIADLPGDYSPLTKFFLGKSDRIMFVLNSELPALKTAADFMDGPENPDLAEKTRFILNRGTANGLNIKNLEYVLGKSIDAVIPYTAGSYAAFPSDGVPFVSARPLSRTSRAFKNYFRGEYGLSVTEEGR